MSSLIRSCAAVTVAAALALGTVDIAHADEGDGARATIIGGEPVATAPWAAGLYWDNHFGCTASIVAARWVLTARHCVNEAPTHVMVGDVRIREGIRADVDGVVRSAAGDVALLHLATPVRTTYARLADTEPPRDSINHIYGWGTIEVGDDAPISDVLKRASVRVTGPAQDAYNGPAIGTTKVDGTAGYGDSGGPQLYRDEVVGVCSTGDYVNTQYASVPAHRDWIRANAGV